MKRSIDVMATGVAIFALVLVLVLPNRLIWISEQAYLFFPLELMVVGLLLLIPGWAGLLTRSLLAVLVSMGVVLRIADLVNYEILGRRFNLIFDFHLLDDASRLLSGTLGVLAPYGLNVVLLVALGFIVWFSFWMLSRIQRALMLAPRASGLSLIVLLLTWGLLNDAGWPRAQTYAWQQLVTHAGDTLESYRDIQEFAQRVDRDLFIDQRSEALFSGLEGKDVLLVFIESYGRSLLEQDPFAESITDTLRQAETELSEQGFSMRSAYLTAVTVGGRSWLNHATFLSGAWVDSQTRYQSLLLSDRIPLNRLFREAGWRTVAAVPAIQMAWPESRFFGYDQIYHAHNFGYEGLPFNWVTMPDQYVWSEVQARELSRPQPRAPLMIEFQLISSHAPWTPVADIVPWGEVENGTIFNDMVEAGPTPMEVWYDIDKIRDHYRRSIIYSLETLSSFLQTYGHENLVVLVVGDHEGAPRITGDWESYDVPIHILSHHSNVVDAFADWQWVPGLLPSSETPVLRMDAFRNRFVETFSVDP